MALVDLIDKHRPAFDYDWRTRFHLPVSAIGSSRMSWGEAIRLLGVIATDPSSQIASAMAEWEHPVSREALVLMDLYDLQHRAKSKRKPSPYPRPWATGRKRFGSGVPVGELQAKLAAHRAAVDADPTLDGKTEVA